ncbi:HlyD family secretion protein [Parasphingorhabdus sp.]|uniref:HlyD family secretion protein n=1 Tax=Parasphingorhabdus sp. TaxID=2709688 RepID=UPI003A8EAF7B
MTNDTAPDEPHDAPTDQTDTGDRRTGRFLWIGLGVAAILAALGLWYASQPVSVPLQGTVEAEEVSVATKAFARVVSLSAAEGDMVRKGEILGELSSPARDLLVSQGEAAVETTSALDAIINQGARPEDIASLRSIAESTRAAANLAAVTARRMNNLFEQGVISAQRRDEANAARVASAANADAAQAQYQRALAGRRQESKAIAAAQERAAKNRLQTARAAAREEQLIAPITGEISRRLAAPGEVVGPAIPIFQIVDIAHPYVLLRINETQYAGVKKGEILSGTVPALGDKLLSFRLTNIGAEAGFTSERATRQSSGFDARSFEIRLEPVDRAHGLRPGMSVLFEWPQ